jgi:penicillin-binding protein 2
MHCWIGKKGGAHGTLGLSDGLKNSCNAFFFQYGNRAGINNIEKAGKMLGLGEKTGIELSDEEAGVLPTPKWLKIHSPKENWSSAYTANVSIGQGLVLATPLQMACVMAAVGNGGTSYVPHLKKKVLDHDELIEEVKPVVRGNFSDYGLTDEKLELVRRGLWKVVNEDGGTGRNARIPGVEVAGKTGTAEAWRPDGVKENHTLFICFAPYKNPKYAICIFLQNGESGGGCSAPIARRIMEQALSLDQGYTVALTALKEVNGHFEKINSVTYEGVAPVALKPNEVDDDVGSTDDVPTPPKAEKIPVARAVPAPTIRDAPDADGSRAVKNQVQPPRRASTFETAPGRSAPAPRPPGR